MMIGDKNVYECDARKTHSSKTVGDIIILLILLNLFLAFITFLISISP
jgi:hypothetical protein